MNKQTILATNLALAHEHILAAMERILQQAELIARLAAEGHNTTQAQAGVDSGYV
jgi:hypothetical protein